MIEYGYFESGSSDVGSNPTLPVIVIIVHINIGFQGESMKEKIKKLKMKIQKMVYWIKKKIYDIRYRRLTYIPEKGLWVSTVVFPALTEDGVCGVTDVFAGNEKKVDFDALHSVYIKKASESEHIHRDVVKCVKGGYIIQNE